MTLEHLSEGKKYMHNSSCAVGVFDSGLGGLTAVKELKKILPNEKIIYFGDTGRVPYGTRSSEIITRYALDDLNFLDSFGVKAVLIACGTVSSIATDTLRSTFDVPIMGVVQPAAQKACELSKTNKIAILATPATVKNAAYQREISKINPNAEVFGVGCPMFVPLVENGYIQHDCEVTRLIADEYISQLCRFNPDVIILGCTHYPIISEIILRSARKLIGDIQIVDSGAQGALAVKNFLQSKNLLSQDKNGTQQYFISDETQNFEKAASIFLGERISNVTKIDIADYTFLKGTK